MSATRNMMRKLTLLDGNSIHVNPDYVVSVTRRSGGDQAPDGKFRLTTELQLAFSQMAWIVCGTVDQIMVELFPEIAS